MSGVHSSFADLIRKHSDFTWRPTPRFWESRITPREVVITSIVIVALSAGLTALVSHWPYYNAPFHQISAAIRHWDFRDIGEPHPQEFWGYSYLSALVAMITGLPDVLAIVAVSSVSFVVANYLGCLLWDATLAAWLMAADYWYIDTAAQGMTDPLFMALLLASFLLFRRGS